MITIPREICCDLRQSLSREWLVTNGLGGPRAIGWRLEDDRHWPGFPQYGSVVVGAGLTQPVPITLAPPDTAVAGDLHLRVTAWFEGGQGNDTHGEITFAYGAPPLAALSPPSVPLALAIQSASNPTRTLRVAFVLPQVGAAQLSAYDIGGRRVATRTVEGRPGRHEATLGNDSMPPGIYMLVVKQGDRTSSARAVVVR